MSRNLDSTSELTEFAPLSPEDKPGFGLLQFSKFFKLGKGGESLDPESTGEGASKAGSSWEDQEDTEVPENVALQYPVDVSEGRSLPNVLKRISNFMALKNVALTSYKDTALKQYWMPDSFSKECYDCGEKFTAFRRRHHCRVCGQIFCSRCCNQEIPGKIMGCTGVLRVCTYCCKVVLSYLQSADIGADLSSDLRALQEDLQTKFGGIGVRNDDGSQSLSPACGTDGGETGSSVRRKPSVGYQEERFVCGRSQSPNYLTEDERCRALQSSSSLRGLYEELVRPVTGLPLQSHRYRLRSYPNCFFGSELVDWLIAQTRAASRVQGLAIGQALLEAGYLESVAEPTFQDGWFLYRPVPSNSLKPQGQPRNKQSPDDETEARLAEIEEEPRLRTSGSTYFLDMNVRDSVVHITRPSEEKEEEEAEAKPTPVATQTDGIEGNVGWQEASASAHPVDGEDVTEQELSSAFGHHLQSLLRQLLNSEGVSQSWSDVVLPVVHSIVDLVEPDLKNDVDEMDIRHYVQVKRLPGGVRSECCIVSGVVCSKNVAHRSMRTKIANPRVLLLRCSVVYQRIEGRLLSLEPVLMQEHEYLRHVVARIAALQPDIVMVYRNVSRLAQEYLLKLGITLILNTKLSVLERVARYTGADIVTSVDAHISKPQLGTCQSFYLKTFQTEHGGTKTLMFFEGCDNPKLSCTLLLRGGSLTELVKLKKIVSFIIFACYNWKKERSFLMDEFAKPPTSQWELVDSEEPQKGNFTKPELKVKDKQEEKKMVVESVSDCSDPLQSYLHDPDDVVASSPTQQLAVAQLPFSNKFRKSLDDTILSISLYLKYSIPYLETELGRHCLLRRYFPPEVFYSKQFQESSESCRSENIVKLLIPVGLEAQLQGVILNPIHPFVTLKITGGEMMGELDTLLALFRASGGRIPLSAETPSCSMDKKEEGKEIVKTKPQRLDVLDPLNHQRLPVLFCSYSSVSNNYPAFCVDPWVVNMFFYGTYDIALGSFLERYCFRPSYVCPSTTCDTPMLDHVRRFVHEPGCVHLALSRVEQLDSRQILMWTWCTKCKTPSPMVPMSPDTWSFSFAKYLELRFQGHVYMRRDADPNTCKHSLHHDHHQYFALNGVVAAFKFSTVRIWDVCLPSPVVTIQRDPNLHNKVMDELRTLAIKGHDVYSAVLEQLLTIDTTEDDIQVMKTQQQREQAHFKTKIEEIQLKLTSPTMESRWAETGPNEKEVEQLLWRVQDSVMYLRRLVSEAVVGWNARFQEAVNAAKRKDEKQKRVSDGTIKPPPSQQLAPVDETAPEEEELMYQTEDEDVVAGNISGDSGSIASETASHLNETESSEEKIPARELQIHPEDTHDRHDKKTVKTILSQILAPSKDASPIQSPWSQQEHYLLPPGPTASIMVHEGQPSSIISYALASHEYQRFLEEAQHKKTGNAPDLPCPSPVNRRKTLSQSSLDRDTSSETSRSNVLSFLRTPSSKNTLEAPGNGSPKTPAADSSSQSAGESEELEESHKKSKSSSSFYIEISFADANCNFHCRVYFAEQFAALRQRVFPPGEEAYVRSLSRCVHWAARGGKSGTTFCKTKDDRFVLKEMSRLELQLFNDFAPHYFNYMDKCLETGQPTLLGKILGVYTVSLRNTQTKSNLLVMENLFYRRSVTHKYDLKGSVRNRLVNPSQQHEGEIVYMDENLLKMTTESPLYILPHSHAVLTRAIEKDTEFLASQSVMDYSLLVGLDTDRRELAVGIIDYIRTFTWDKKLETMVKKSVIMGGQGKQPTIIQPKDYRDRFITAMHRYFLPVPDRWAGLGQTVASHN